MANCSNVSPTARLSAVAVAGWAYACLEHLPLTWVMCRLQDRPAAVVPGARLAGFYPPGGDVVAAAPGAPRNQAAHHNSCCGSGLWTVHTMACRPERMVLRRPESYTRPRSHEFGSAGA